MDLVPLFARLAESSIEMTATLLAAGTAIWGICAWRREHVGRRRIDLAEEVLALVYEAQDVFEAIRSPLGYPEEGSTRNPSPEEVPTETAMLNSAFVQIERYNKRADLFAKLRSLEYRFIAQHGRESGAPFEELNSARLSLKKPFNRPHPEIRQLRRQRKTTDATDYDAKIEKLWERWQEKRDSEELNADGNDLILKRFVEAVSGLEETCRAVIGPQV